MKMMKKCRALCALLTLALLLGASLAVTVSADDLQGVQWIYANADHTKLNGDGVSYEMITLPADCTLIEARERYVYMNSPIHYAHDSGSSGTVYAGEKGGYLIYVQDDYGSDGTLFCRSDMLSSLEDYFKGEAGRYVLRVPYLAGGYTSRDRFYDMSDEFAEALLSVSDSGTGKTYEVSDLERLEIMELCLHDESGMLSTILGAVYTMPDGRYGFVDYATLNNSHFDADGNFSYRQGQVTVYDLGDDFASEMKRGSDGEKNYALDQSITYEYYEYHDEDMGIIGSDYTDEEAIAAFWIIFVMAGYLVPIAPLVVGLVFVHSKKMSHPKRWYIVAGLSLLWILLAVVVTVLLLA